MQKIFYENSYKKEFVAEIIDIKEIDNKFHIVLDSIIINIFIIL